ncbi:hypothetical protein PV326_002591 [Microctonus aethiopoides]|nr:hypothetical protein PV326_002591 [Microctonus aethiopoides]
MELKIEEEKQSKATDEKVEGNDVLFVGLLIRTARRARRRKIVCREADDYIAIVRRGWVRFGGRMRQGNSPGRLCAIVNENRQRENQESYNAGNSNGRRMNRIKYYR